MPYVQRDEQNNIIGQYNNPQEGIAEEWLEDAAPELVAIRVAQIKAEKLAALALVVNEKRQQGFTYAGRTFSLATDDLAKHIACSLHANYTKDGILPWRSDLSLRSANGEWLDVPTENDMIAISAAGIDFYMNISAKWKEKELTLKALVTPEDVNAFDPWSGWDG